jgi:hypothetical protein
MTGVSFGCKAWRLVSWGNSPCVATQRRREGHSIEATTDRVIPGDSRRTLGLLWVLYGVVRLVMALFLALFTPTATVMFGALLSRVPEPFALMNDFHLLYLSAIILAAIGGAFGLLAGLALLAARSAARTLALIAGFLSLSDLPFGTTLGIYTLIVYLR